MAIPGKRLRCFVAAIAYFSLTNGTLSQDAFPTRSLQLVVPFPAGGAADVFARLVSSALETQLGKSVVVVNKAGAGTAIGAQAVATAPADGYTMLLAGSSTFTMLPAVRNNLPFDVKDFAPLARVVNFHLALVTYVDNPVANLEALIAEAKANPDKLTLASFGTATSSHSAGEMFKAAAGLKMVHLPYKGSAPAMNDLIGKHIPYLVDTVVATQPHVEAGKVRALAVLSGKRSSHLPWVPTAIEQGLKNVDLELWLAISVPKATPSGVRRVLSGALANAMQTEAVRVRASELGFEPVFVEYEDWGAEMSREIELMRSVARKAGIKEE